jgi:VWFA-related protein
VPTARGVLHRKKDGMPGTMWKGKWIAWALWGLLTAPVAGPAQREQNPQQPRFNVQVNLVSLDVEVLDPSGNPVLGLTQKDFSIKEGGKPVDISHFAWQSERPVNLAIVLDTSAISTDKLTKCKRFIVELAHRLARADEICLFTFDTRDAYLEQDFTPSRLHIVEALENIGVPSGRSGSILKELFGKQPLTGLAIDLALDKVHAVPKGKKALLVISNRFRGLGPVTVEHIRESDCTLSTLEFDNKAARWASLGGDQISKNQLMQESGGRNFSADTEDVEGVCRKIVFSLKNHYVLGYLTEIGAAEKKPRRVEVRVPGKNYIIHSRRSYQVQ